MSISENKILDNVINLAMGKVDANGPKDLQAWLSDPNNKLTNEEISFALEADSAYRQMKDYEYNGKKLDEKTLREAARLNARKPGGYRNIDDLAEDALAASTPRSNKRP